MLSPRYTKVRRDLWVARSRIAMMLVAITLSLTAVGTVLTTKAINDRELHANYLSTNPASATIEIQGALDPSLLDAVRAQPRPLVSLSDPVIDEHQELKRFLRAKLYNHPKVREVMVEAGETLKALFDAYMKDSSRLPPEHQSLAMRAEADGGVSARARVVADYVAGMTDRFAYAENAALARNR